MSERRKIEDRLRKKEQEVAVLEDKLRAGRVYIQALRDILKMLSEGIDDVNDTDSSLRTGSAVDQARRVILDRKNPVHIDEILSALGRDVTREAKASLTSSLAAYVRRGEIFTRPAPNTFGLSELGHDVLDEAKKEPPVDFGRVSSIALDDDIPF
jgi:hypothetical protein